MYDIKAFSLFSEPFASPLFPKKGELVTLSIVFSEKPDSVILRADGNTGLVYSYQMREKGRLVRMQEVHEPEPDAGDADVEDIPADVLQDMIRRLPDGYRTVFNLYVMEELSHKEIASMLGISESTSASQFHRARAILASAIREYRKNNRH